MFTGVVTHMGRVKAIAGARYTIATELVQLKLGSSVAVNGACLTASDMTKDAFSIEVMPETLRKTMLGELKVGNLVNLELPMSTTSLFEGHMVQGHIDGVARIKRIERQSNSRLITFNLEPKLAHYIVEKGFVAVNGISLTVIAVGKDWFTVGIIPYTWKHTMLRTAGAGDKVNIELDIMAKYLEKLVARRKS